MSATALAELKALRAAGKKRLSSYQVEDQGAIYDEVDEEGYKKVVRGRLNRDDFVVDDNGDGYADDGREEWHTERRYYTSSDGEEDVPVRGKTVKRKREEEKEKVEKTNKNIAKYFSTGPAVPSKPKVRALRMLSPCACSVLIRSNSFKLRLMTKRSWPVFLAKWTLTLSLTVYQESKP